MGGEWCKTLPESSYPFRPRHGVTTVDYPSICPCSIELEPGLDHINRLETTRLHYPAERTRYSLNVRRNGFPASIAGWRRCHLDRSRRGFESGGGWAGEARTEKRVLLCVLVKSLMVLFHFIISPFIYFISSLRFYWFVLGDTVE